MSLTLYSCCQVHPEIIEQFSSWDLYPYLDGEPISQTRRQIEQVGILLPPLVIKTAVNTYELVSGFRTYNSWQKTNTNQPLFCRIFTPDISISTILEVLYYESNNRKPLGAIETAHFIRLAGEKLAKEKDIAKLLETVGLQPGLPYRKRTLQLLQLEQQIQRAMWEERINLSTAREMLLLNDKDRLTLFSLAQELEFGSSKLRRLLYLMRDLAGRDNISFNTLAADTDLKEIMNHPEMNIPQKGQAILKILQYRQNSTFYTAEKSFEQWKNSLNLPDSYAIEHSKSFESDETTLSITFSDREKLEQALPALANVTKKNQEG